MSMRKDYRSSIEELTATTPKKKAALIRSLRPTIEAALRSGQTRKDLWDTLDKQGIHIGYHVFQMTLRRARRSKAETAPGGWGKDTKPSDSQHRRDADMPTLEARDPLANLKRLEANRPGFTGAQRRERLRRQEERRNLMTKSNAKGRSNATIIQMLLQGKGGVGKNQLAAMLSLRYGPH